MTDKQLLAMTAFFASWLDKASVGCLLAGLFQLEHMFGGLVGATVCFLGALIMKIRSAK